jgi:hypothetical protein
MGRLAEADAQGRRQGAGAKAALLPAAVEQRVELDASADPEAAYAFGSMHLVRGDGDHVAGVQGNVDAAERLDGVAEEERAAGVGELGEALDRLDDADLVVDQHGGDEAGAVVDPLGGKVEVDEAVRLDGEDVRFETLGAQPFDRVEHAGMFGGEGDDPAPVLGQACGGALEGPVGGFGGAGGEVEAALRVPSRISGRG